MISLAEKQDKTYLYNLRKKETFSCTYCNEKLILKLGTKRIYHFAHEKGAACTDSYDRESEYHMLGKLKIYNWLKGFGVSPHLEPYYPLIKQRADISFCLKGKTYVIEFQCSTISEDLFMKRTAGFRKLSLVPVWILAGKNINRIKNHKVAISSFQYLFLNKNSSNEWFLPSYCPQTNLFIRLNNPVPISSRNAMTDFFIKPLDQLQVHDLLDPEITCQFHTEEWRRDMHRFKTTLLTHGSFNKDPFLLELYSLSLNPLLIPPFVGIPLRLNPVIQNAPFIWQTYIFIDHLFTQPIGKRIHFHEVFVSILRRINRSQISLRNLPMIKERQLPFAINDYLMYLERIGILGKENEKTFILMKPIEVAKNYDEWTRWEEKFYTKDFQAGYAKSFA